MFLQRTLFVVVMWLAVMPVALGATRAEAQSIPPTGSLVAVCAAATYAAVACAALVAAGIAYFVYSGGASDAGTLGQVATGMFNWWQSLSEAEALEHRDYVDTNDYTMIDSLVIAAWQEWVDAEVGSEYEAVLHSSPFADALHILSPDLGTGAVSTNVPDGLWTSDTVSPTLGLSSCTSTNTRLSVYLFTPVDYGANALFSIINPADGSVLASSLQSVPASPGQSRSVVSGAYNCQSFPAGVQMRVQLRYSSNTMPVRVELGPLRWEGTGQVSPLTSAEAASALYWNVSTDGAVVLAPTGEFGQRPIYIPVDADDYIGAVPGSNDSVARTDGTTGAAVGDVIPNTEDTSGIFGGLLGVLNNIWSKLDTMYNTLTSTLARITDLPNAIVSALSSAVTPTVGIQARTTALADVAEVRAPFSWYAGLTASLDGLFAADAAGCVTVGLGPMPSYAVPYFGSETPMELCAPAGLSAITLPLSRLVAWALVVVYAIARIHGFLNGGMKEGTQMRLFD